MITVSAEAEYVDVADSFLSFLTENYLTYNIVSNGLLIDCMYSLPHDDKTECTYGSIDSNEKTDWKMYW